jgi:DNA-binding transcriptional ArsR family regulator
MDPHTKLRDLTEPRSPLAVEVDSSPVYDLLLSLWVATSGEALTDYELSGAWFRELEERTSSVPQVEEIADTAGNMWIAVLNLVPMVPGARDIESVVAWLESSDGVDLRAALLDLKCHDVDQNVVRAAAEGDEEAMERILTCEALSPEWSSDLRRLMAMPGRKLTVRVAEAIRGYRDEVYRDIEKHHEGPIAKDAESKRVLVPATPVDRMIEIATNGVQHSLPPHVARLVLAPSVVVRPWSLLAGYGDTFILCYPVADEALDQSAEAPPRMLVKAYRALGDERRLRILRLLASEPTSLPDLADHFGVAKSTLHHHIGILRAGGLVTVSVDPESGQMVYGLRMAALEEAARLMDIYLESS